MSMKIRRKGGRRKNHAYTSALQVQVIDDLYSNVNKRLKIKTITNNKLTLLNQDALKLPKIKTEKGRRSIFLLRSAAVQPVGMGGS